MRTCAHAALLAALIGGMGCGIVDVPIGDLPGAQVECAEPARFTRIGAGDDHVCGIDRTGNLWCWGQNEEGQIGDGSNSDRERPVPIALPGPVASVGGGDDHSCAVLEDGRVFCWGSDRAGELGQGDAHLGTSEPEPLEVVTTVAFATIDSYQGHNCAIATDGSLWCWGENEYGQLGVGDVIDRSMPTRVGARTDWMQVAVGQRHTCALPADGVLYCWGTNSAYQLGLVDDADRVSPEPVGITATVVAAGARSTCAIDPERALWCWGTNEYGALGVGDLEPRPTPTRVGTDTGWMAVAVGTSFACALDVEGAAFCMGSESRLGRDTASTVPVPIDIGAPAIQAVAGKHHGCVLRDDGAVVCWGENNDGEVGAGDRVDRAFPTLVCL